MAKTGAEKLAAKQKRLSKRGSIQGQLQAENLRAATIDPMKAKMTSQERGGMALEAGAAAGAASAPAMQQLAEAGMMGDRQALSAVGSDIQQGASDAAYQGALAAAITLPNRYPGARHHGILLGAAAQSVAQLR